MPPDRPELSSGSIGGGLGGARPVR
jgi:hypothetical protein